MIEIDTEGESSSSNGKDLLMRNQTWEPKNNILNKHLIGDYFQKLQTFRNHMNFCSMVISSSRTKMAQLNPTVNKTLLWLCIIIVGLGLTLACTNLKTIDLGVMYD